MSEPLVTDALKRHILNALQQVGSCHTEVLIVQFHPPRALNIPAGRLGRTIRAAVQELQHEGLVINCNSRLYPNAQAAR